MNNDARWSNAELAGLALAGHDIHVDSAKGREPEAPAETRLRLDLLLALDDDHGFEGLETSEERVDLLALLLTIVEHPADFQRFFLELGQEGARWRNYCEEQSARAQAARETKRDRNARADETLLAAVNVVRMVHPTWGRRSIARELLKRDGTVQSS